MIKTGLIGYPLKHSYSKNIFKRKKDIEYKNYEIKNLKNIRDFIFKNRISGLNVTAPYKEEIIKYIDELENKTNKIKSVNTLKVCFESKKIKGFNTDIHGFELSLKRFIKNKKIKAILFGDGGVAKTIKYVLEKEKIQYIQVSRKNKKNIKYCELEKKHFENHQLIINSTILGMHPQEKDKININYEYINEQHLVFDLIYNPQKTEMIKECLKRGAKTKNGLEMLKLQAEKSFDIWKNEKY